MYEAIKHFDSHPLGNNHKFLMGLKEKYTITQVALQGVIEGVTHLVESHIDALHSQVQQQLLLMFIKQPLMPFGHSFQSVGHTLIPSKAPRNTVSTT